MNRREFLQSAYRIGGLTALLSMGCSKNLIAQVLRGTALAAPSYLINEDFEGTGAPAGWTAAGTGRDYDYSTSVLGGTQVLRLLYMFGAISAQSPNFDATGDVYVAFRFYPLVLPNTTNSTLLALRTSGGEEGYIRTSNGGYLRAVITGAIGSSSADGVLVALTPIYIKARYQKGTGSNALMTVWYSSTGGSGTWTQAAQTTGGSGTSDIVAIAAYSDNPSNYLYKYMRVSNADINF